MKKIIFSSTAQQLQSFKAFKLLLALVMASGVLTLNATAFNFERIAKPTPLKSSGYFYSSILSSKILTPRL
ncbi:MAG: hypothetical protein ABIO44_00635, partial [Saprospiraceae bacterium]